MLPIKKQVSQLDDIVLLCLSKNYFFSKIITSRFKFLSIGKFIGLFTIIFINFYSVKAQEDVSTSVFSEPQLNYATILADTSIIITINIDSVSEAYGFQFDLEYDTNALIISNQNALTEGVFFTENDKVNTYCIIPDITTPGLIKNVACTRTEVDSGISGSGTLTNIVFTVNPDNPSNLPDTSSINLSNVRISNLASQLLEHTTHSSQVVIKHLIDVTIDTILISNDTFPEGDTLSVRVLIVNTGTKVLDTVPLTYTIGSSESVKENFIGNLYPGNSAEFTFNTTYIIPDSNFQICIAATLENDYFPENDIKYTGITSIAPRWNIGVDSIVLVNDSIPTGDSVTVTAWLTNYGSDTLKMVPVSYTVNDNTVSESYNGILPPNTFLEYTFKEAFYAPEADFEVCVATGLGNDFNIGNDTACSGVISIAPRWNIGVDSIVLVNDSIPTGDSVTVTAWLTNYGSDTLKMVPVSYTVNGNTVSESYNGILPTNTSLKYTFKEAFYAPEIDFEVCVATGLENDFSTGNDTVCSAITSIAPRWNIGVDSIVLVNDSIPTGDSVTVTAWLTNYGSDTLKMVPVSYTVNGNTVSESYNGILPTNTSLKYTFKEAFYAPETDFEVCVATKLMNDFKTENNEACKTIIALSPRVDIGVDTIIVNDSIPTGDTITITTILTNYGATTLYEVPVNCKINDTAITEYYNGTLPPNTSVEYTFTTTFNMPETNLSVCVSTSMEDDSNNENDKTCTTIISMTPKINAGVYSILLANDSIPVGDPITVTAILTNSGTTTLNTIPLVCSLNDSIFTEIYNGTLAPNASAIYTFNTTLYVPETDFEICVSTALEEDSFRKNDTKCITVTSIAPRLDIGVDSILIVNDSVPAREPMEIAVILTNYGSNTLYSFPVSCTLNNQTISKSYSGAIQPNTSVKYTFNTMLYAPETNFEICVSTGLWNDYNSENNVKCKNVNSIAPKLDAGINSIVLKNNSIKPGDTVTVTAMVTNYGSDTLKTIPLICTLDNNVVSETYNGILAPNASVEYIFNHTFYAPETNFEVCVSTALEDDYSPENNEQCTTVKSTVTIDAGISSIILPGAESNLDTYFAIEVVIKNFGSTTLKEIPVMFSITTDRHETVTFYKLWAGELFEGDSVHFSYGASNSLSIQNGSFLQLCAYTLLENDAKATNDTTYKNIIVTAIDELTVPDLQLAQNIPNPAVGHTNINYSVPISGNMVFHVRNILGNTIYSQQLKVTKGEHTIQFETGNLPEGIYFYYIELNGKRLAKKMIVKH